MMKSKLTRSSSRVPTTAKKPDLYETVQTVCDTMIPKTEALKAQIESLETQLAAAKQLEEAEKKDRIKSFKRKYVFTLKPVDERSRHWDRLYDDTLCWLVLCGEFTNYKEFKEIGGSIFGDNPSGSMKYLYNIANNKIVMRYGGGNIYINDADVELAYKMLEDRIISKPNGECVEHDVTDIISSLPHYKWDKGVF